jgi:hypothetical protein
MLCLYVNCLFCKLQQYRDVYTELHIPAALATEKDYPIPTTEGPENQSRHIIESEEKSVFSFGTLVTIRR